jgi:hypothetical protein
VYKKLKERDDTEELLKEAKKEESQRMKEV